MEFLMRPTKALISTILLTGLGLALSDCVYPGYAYDPGYYGAAAYPGAPGYAGAPAYSGGAPSYAPTAPAYSGAPGYAYAPSYSGADYYPSYYAGYPAPA